MSVIWDKAVVRTEVVMGGWPSLKYQWTKSKPQAPIKLRHCPLRDALERMLMVWGKSRPDEMSMEPGCSCGFRPHLLDMTPEI